MHYYNDYFDYSFYTILRRKPSQASHGNSRHVPFYRNLPCFNQRSKTGWRGPKKS